MTILERYRHKKARNRGYYRLYCMRMNRLDSYMVPRAGLEPARPQRRWILSPLRLPIPPPRQGRLLIIGALAVTSSLFDDN